MHDISQKYKMGIGVANQKYKQIYNKKRIVQYLVRPLEHYQTTF